MGLISGLFVVSILAMAAFCFYCGVITVSNKIKDDGLLEAIKMALIIFVVTAVVVLSATRVGNALSPRSNRTSVGITNV